MAGRVLPRRGWVRKGLAASLLALLAGCTTLPTPLSQLPAAAALPSLFLPSVAPSPEAAAESPPPKASESSPSRLAALARRLLKKREAPVPVSVAQVEPQPEPEKLVDEKYRFTGEDALELERGHASWYGGQFHGRRTASGETYDKYALTAAHKTLPFGTIVRVRSLAHGREVYVRINDRGPFAPGRVIDVSQAAAEALGLTRSGVGRVSLQVEKSGLKQAGWRQSQLKARSSPTKARNAKAKVRNAKAKTKVTTKTKVANKPRASQKRSAVKRR